MQCSDCTNWPLFSFPCKPSLLSSYLSSLLCLILYFYCSNSGFLGNAHELSFFFFSNTAQCAQCKRSEGAVFVYIAHTMIVVNCFRKILILPLVVRPIALVGNTCYVGHVQWLPSWKLAANCDKISFLWKILALSSASALLLRLPFCHNLSFARPVLISVFATLNISSFVAHYFSSRSNYLSFLLNFANTLVFAERSRQVTRTSNVICLIN